MKEYTIYWRDGKRDVLTGSNAANAFTNAGYGAGAMGAVDFYADGDDDSYEWNAKTREWNKKK